MINYDDPFAAAADPQTPVYSNDIYGDIVLDMWFCTLKKGVGKAPFIPNVDSPADRRTCVDVNITDLSGTNYKRSFIAEIRTDGWQAVTLPSLQALGVKDMRTMNGVFVHALMDAFGEYTDKTTGEKKQRTAPRIVTIYKDRDACEAAAQGAEGAATQADWVGNPAPAANGNGAATATNEAEKAVALAFLPAVLAGCRTNNGYDVARVEAALKNNPILARHFTLASPEVTQAMAQALTEPVF